MMVYPATPSPAGGVMRVKRTTQETVYPATPSPAGGAMELSKLDLIFLPFAYVSVLFFFHGQPPQEACVSLKRSLSEVLAMYYPCAGRFREKSNGELEIVCNDEGAVLHQTWVDCKYDDFLPNFDLRPDFKLLLPALHDASAAISHVTPFLAQITHFECGRACLGIRMHHTQGDGLSMSHFLSSWAAIATSKARPHPKGAEPQLAIQQPHLDRSLLDSRRLPSAATSDHPEYRTRSLNRGSPTNIVSKIFAFTPSHVDALRAESKPGSYTRFEALAAHLWRGITLARGLAPNQEIRLGMAVDGRKRFKPPLPQNYFGNAVFLGYVAAKAEELVGNSLSFAGDLIKAAVANVSDMHMRSTLAFLARKESPESVHFNSFYEPFICVVISSWSRFPLYDLDFGWGKPSFVRVPSMNGHDGMIHLLPSPLGEGHVDAQVFLHEDHMPKLENYLNREHMR